MADGIAEIYADGWSRIVATMIRFTGGDWDLAQECTQDAFAQALLRWPDEGTPDQPLAWLTTVARRRALDRIRRAGVEREKLREVAMEPVPPPYAADADIPDERLELMFACCHPALTVESQVALTLRSVAGMSTAEIARAFLVSEKTLGQRLFRAKQRIRQAGIPLRVPQGHLLPERLSAVLHVLYLLFNEGWSGQEKLSREAIRIGRTLTALMPDEPEALGLVALMLLQDARRESRTGADGALLTLDEQDRSRWNRRQIDEGAAMVERALRHQRAGAFQIQAAIAACHATAPSMRETDWPQIVGLYDLLQSITPGPVIALNRAVAVAMASGPEAGLTLLDTIDGLDRYHLLHATRAELLRRAGRPNEAVASLSRAVQLAPTEAERRLLTERAAASGRTGPQNGSLPHHQR